MSFIRKHIKLFIVILVVIAIAIAAATYMHLQKGRMLLDERANQIAQKQSDERVVDYYKNVCDATTVINDSAKDFIKNSETTIGLDTPAISHAYTASLGSMVGDYKSMTNSLIKLNDDAPTAVRADGEKRDFKGAIKPAIDVISKNETVLQNLKDDKRWESDNPKTVGKIVSESLTTVNDVSSKSTNALVKSLQDAPVFTKATLDQILASKSCSKLMNNDLKDHQDDVIKDIVSLYDLTFTSHHDVRGAFDRISFMSDSSGASPRTIHDAALKIFSSIRDTSTKSRDDFIAWAPTIKKDDPGYDAVQENLVYHDQGIKTYSDVAAWSQSVVDRLNGIDAQDGEGLNKLFNDLSNEIRDNQINESRFATRVMTQIDVPTRGTANAINEIRQKYNKNNVPQNVVVNSVVDAYARSKQSHIDFMNSVQQINATLENIANASPNQALGSLSGSFVNLANVSKNNQTRLNEWKNTEKDSSVEYTDADKVGYLPSRGADVYAKMTSEASSIADKLRTTPPQVAADEIKRSVDRFRALLDEESGWFINSLLDMPQQSDATMEAINAKREALSGETK